MCHIVNKSKHMCLQQDSSRHVLGCYNSLGGHKYYQCQSWDTSELHDIGWPESCQGMRCIILCECHLLMTMPKFGGGVLCWPENPSREVSDSPWMAIAWELTRRNLNKWPFSSGEWEITGGGPLLRRQPVKKGWSSNNNLWFWVRGTWMHLSPIDLG